MSTLGMDDDLLYGPANTDLMDWPQGMMPEEVSQDPTPCTTTLTDKQEIELLREQVRALKEENQVLKLSYAKLLKTKTAASGNKNVSNSKLLVLVQQELEQKKLLCENLAQKAGFYKTKYKSLKTSMFSQAMQHYNGSPSEEAVCTPDKPSRLEFRDRTSADSFAGSQLKLSNNIAAKLPINGPRLLNLPSISSDLSQEESSSNIKPIILESHRQVPNLVQEDSQLMICHLANMNNSETPSTSLADEEAFQGRQTQSGRDRPKVFELSYLPDMALGKREPKIIEDEEPIYDCPVSPIIQLPNEVVLAPALKPLELASTFLQQPATSVITDSGMQIEPSLPLDQINSTIIPAVISATKTQKPILNDDLNDAALQASTFYPTFPIGQSVILATIPISNNNDTTAPETSTKSVHTSRRTPTTNTPSKNLAKPPVRISHGTSDEEESSLESEGLLAKLADSSPQTQDLKKESQITHQKSEQEGMAHQRLGIAPTAQVPIGMGIFSLQTGHPQPQATVGRLSKPAFLEAQEVVPKLEAAAKPIPTKPVQSGWSKVYSTCWKLVENLQNAQHQTLQTEIKEQFVQLLNLFREIASKDVDVKAVYPPTTGATPLEMLLQPQLQEKQYSVKQVLSYQPESGESKFQSCQQFVVQTICFLVFISNYQDCSEVKELAQQSGILSSGLISDPLLQSKFLKLQEIVASSQRRNSTSSTKTSSGHYGLLRVAFEHLVFVCERQMVPFDTQDLFMSNLLAQKASFNELRDAGHYAAEKAGRAGLSVPFFTDLEDLLSATRLLFHTMKNLGTGFQRTAHQTLRGFFSNRKYRNTAQQLVACLLLRQAAHANF